MAICLKSGNRLLSTMAYDRASGATGWCEARQMFWIDLFYGRSAPVGLAPRWVGLAQVIWRAGVSAWSESAFTDRAG